jgi:uncharacterized integral membrane protein
MWLWRLFFLALIMVLLLGFAIQNLEQKVEVVLYKWHFTQVPLILVMFESFVVGVVILFIFTAVHDLQMRRELRRQRGEVKRLKEELSSLRNIPFEEETPKEEGES